MCLWSSTREPGAKLTSEVFRALVRSTVHQEHCACLAHHKKTQAKAKLERADGLISGMLCAHANGRKDD